MGNIIHLLSDAIANQIAAGEVIQRPASAVKELLENAVDAGSTNIQLILKDSGRTLIQVVDNGKGMSFADARLAFERHATSKITTAEDLFHIKTKGFRGEALASIAAIAQVELKTKQAEDTIGTSVLIEGSIIKEHTPTVTQDGSSFAVKNLFFNVPARRNFLKSDNVEFGHIEEEFYRVALIHYNIAFSLFHNGKLLLQTQPSNFKIRIVSIFGNHFKDKLFPIEQNTDYMNISGFIAKPESAKKKKPEQYLFINNRYIRHNLLNYAIESAFTELIPQGYKPAYFIYIDINPEKIDINVSPTKVEVKLQDERLVFGFLNSTVKKSLGTLSLTPRIDFDYEPGLDVSNFPEKKDITPPQLNINPNYNPFHAVSNNPTKSSSYSSDYHGKIHNKNDFDNFSNFLKDIHTEKIEVLPNQDSTQNIEFVETEKREEENPFQGDNFLLLNSNIILCMFNQQIAFVNIVYARERILYENYLFALQNKPIAVQQSLFPETITLTAGKAELLNEIKTELVKLGYEIEQINNTSFAINGAPMCDEPSEFQEIIENLIDSYKSNIFLYRTEKDKNIALSMAKQKRSRCKPLTIKEEICDFLNQLFACQVPQTSPSGKKIIHFMSFQEVEQLFNE